MQNIRYKTVKKSDRDQIISLYKQAGWWTNEDECDISFVDRIVERTFLFAVALDKDKVVGMGRAISDGISDAYIQDVTVLKDYRKKGIGGNLIRLLIKRLKEHNIGWIGLISEPGSDKFYKELGFSEMKGSVPFVYKK